MSLIRITYPAWHDIARRRAKSGVSRAKLADEYGVSISRMGQIVTDNWKLYMIMFLQANKERRKDTQLAGFQNDLSKYEFVPVDKLSPSQREADRKEEKRNFRVKHQEDTVAKRREFDTVKKMEDGKMRLGAVIRCGKEGCTCSEEYYSGSSVNPAYLEKEFQRRGWIVGASYRADLCPTHAAALRAPKPKPAPMAPFPAEAVFSFKKETPVSVAPASVIELPEIVDAALPVEVPAPVLEQVQQAQAAQDMSRTDRRIVFAKLDEVYIDEKTGYKGDWDDKKIATDLGIPVEWVATVREADFGPELNASMRAKSHEDLAKLSESIERSIVLLDKKIEIAQDLDVKLKSALTDVSAAVDRAEQLSKNIETEDGKMEQIFTRFDTEVADFKKMYAEFKRSTSAA